MPANLDHVTWIGGSPCSGKSTIAALLADRHGLRRYDCDAAFERTCAAPPRTPNRTSTA